MNMKPILSALLFVAGLLALPSLAAPRVAVPAQHTQPVCSCCPEVYITFAPSCNCTIQLANEVRRIGVCPVGTCSIGGQCGDPTKSCKLTATANEVGGGCTGTQAISIVDQCGGDSNSTTMPCSSNGGATQHVITLDCEPCTCPGVGECL